MKDSIAHSNLFLVPKIPSPTKVTDFRPISVCNLIYKVISKILAKRMQPWMDGIISRSQTAFIPGRDIYENIMLLREILHTFRRDVHEDSQFVLKVDLAKTFDRVWWEYLFVLLPKYGFPEQFCRWIKACVTSAKFTILFNGDGDGFIRPTRGLRQGCTLSPYLFIISMDPLARVLDLNQKRGRLRGLKVARSANLLTCSIFADDLLLMGKVTQNKVARFLNILQNFTAISGMMINQAKSKVWFSYSTPEQDKVSFINHLNVSEAGRDEKYLGCPVSVQRDCDFDYLVDKFENRLNQWKSNFLTHAGRLVLIQSVFQSPPVYAMGTVLIPKKVYQIDNHCEELFLGRKQ